MALPTGLSIVIWASPLLRRQEGTISTPPALAPVVEAVVDRRRQEVFLQAEEVEAEAAVVRPVPDQVVGVAAVQAAVQVGAAVEVEAEAEFSPADLLAPQLPNLPNPLSLVALEGVDAHSNKMPPLAHARIEGPSSIKALACDRFIRQKLAANNY
jgi:hypothetical protein